MLLGVRLRASVASEYGERRIEGIGGVYAGGGLRESEQEKAYGMRCER